MRRVLGVVIDRVDPRQPVRHVRIEAVDQGRGVDLHHEPVPGAKHPGERKDLDEVLVDLERGDVYRVRGSSKAAEV